MLTISEQELQNIAPRVLEKKIKRYACACKLLRGQKRRKRQFRQLWIARINAAAE